MRIQIMDLSHVGRRVSRAINSPGLVKPVLTVFLRRCVPLLGPSLEYGMEGISCISDSILRLRIMGDPALTHIQILEFAPFLVCPINNAVCMHAAMSGSG